MGRSQETFNKKEVRNKKEKKRKEKEKKKLAKKESGKSSMDDMIAYVDENGMLTTEPPDPTKKKKDIKLEDIEIGTPTELRKNSIPSEKELFLFLTTQRAMVLSKTSKQKKVFSYT